MRNYKPVSIPNAAFIFCRYSIAVLIWSAFFLKSEILLSTVCLIFLLSAILKVQKAPMVWLYSVTFNKIRKSKDVMVNQHAIFFAHVLGLILSSLCLILVCLSGSGWAWYAVLAFAILKTISALGFCPAAKLYDCVANGTCCVNKSKRNGSCPSC